MSRINLQDIHGCLSEIQACARGMAELDHQYHLALDNLTEAEAEYDSMEAAVAAGVRSGSDSALTATEVKGRILTAIEENPERKAKLDRVRSARAHKAKIERFTRSLEKRMSGAQSAQKGHDSLGRYGGGA